MGVRMGEEGSVSSAAGRLKISRKKKTPKSLLKKSNGECIGEETWTNEATLRTAFFTQYRSQIDKLIGSPCKSGYWAV